ncbi:hypothetical protein KV557_09835 [Kitasatospora aureofaciens]|uniref:hypothetical protein n=1 Tax=Kitasatospora aureofaciens TaxID=1894 RepID=UPI001C486E50|nr:hypothetical protein [Kitasatospora aureofaciens]MBV6697423.1 hypothetical protein [Kitasatospora aureofaciens]
MTSPPPALDVYREIQQIREALIRVDGKLDGLSEHKTQLADHESRLRHLEERRLPHSALNIISAVVAAVALVWQAAGH